MKTLPKPYGDCEDTIPVSNCKLKCKTKHVIETCGCYAAYMESVVGEKSKLYEFYIDGESNLIGLYHVFSYVHGSSIVIHKSKQQRKL